MHVNPYPHIILVMQLPHHTCHAISTQSLKIISGFKVVINHEFYTTTVNGSINVKEIYIIVLFRDKVFWKNEARHGERFWTFMYSISHAGLLSLGCQAKIYRKPCNAGLDSSTRGFAPFLAEVEGLSERSRWVVVENVALSVVRGSATRLLVPKGQVEHLLIGRVWSVCTEASQMERNTPGGPSKWKSLASGGVARKEKGSALLDDTGEPVADGIDTEISPLRRPHNPSILWPETLKWQLKEL